MLQREASLDFRERKAARLSDVGLCAGACLDSRRRTFAFSKTFRHLIQENANLLSAGASEQNAHFQRVMILR